MRQYSFRGLEIKNWVQPVFGFHEIIIAPFVFHFDAQAETPVQLGENIIS